MGTGEQRFTAASISESVPWTVPCWEGEERARAGADSGELGGLKAYFDVICVSLPARRTREWRAFGAIAPAVRIARSSAILGGRD